MKERASGTENQHVIYFIMPGDAVKGTGGFLRLNHSVGI